MSNVWPHAILECVKALFISLFDIQRHPHDTGIQGVAILAEVRLEMIKYILWRGDVEGEGGCEGKIPGIIFYGLCLKLRQSSFKHTEQFPEIFFRLGAGVKNTKNGDFSALPQNCG